MLRLRELRKLAHLTQEELISKFNIQYGKKYTAAAISQFENGKRVPETQSLMDFADFFGVTLDYLLGRDDAASPAPPAPLSPADIPQLPATGANFALLPQAPASPASAAPATPVLPAPGRLPIDPPLTDKEIDIALSYRYGTQDTRDLIDYAISRDKNQDASTSAAASPEAS